jgi:hypothetical protein
MNYDTLVKPEDMARCAFCHQPFKLPPTRDTLPAMFVAHGVAGLAHQGCLPVLGETARQIIKD